MVQVKAKYTNVPVQTDVGRSQQTQDAKKRKQPETTNTQKNQTNPTKQKPDHANKPKPRRRGSQKHQPGQRTTRRADKTNQSKGAGEEGKRRPANKERADAREGSRGRRENAAQAKVGAYSFSGVLRGFWITRGRIPQCRSEGHMNNTHSMVERAKSHTGPKPCCL